MLQLTGRDVRRIDQLLDECRELGDDAFAWRFHLGEGLRDLIGADLVFCVETGNCTGERPIDLGIAESGWELGFNREGWSRAILEFQHNPFYSLGLRKYFESLRKDDGVVKSRKDLVNNNEWEASFDRLVIHNTIGVDNVVWGFRSISGTVQEHSGVIALREQGRCDFNNREKIVLKEIMRQVADATGGPLSRFQEILPSQLPPRTRDVLRALLEGDGDKQIAQRLQLSRFTVNTHTKKIYNHFKVQGRSELMARWIRRGWKIGDW
jgi:DNA-binding CsgD family transcriptional regulator